MRCPNCETDNRDDAKFCDECGFPLGGVSTHAISTTSGKSDGPVIELPDSDGESWPASRAHPEGFNEAIIGAVLESGVEEAAQGLEVDPFDIGIELAEDDLEAAPMLSGVEPQEDRLEQELAGASQFGVVDAQNAEDGVSHDGSDAAWNPEVTEKMPRVEDSPPEVQRDFRAESAKARGSRKGIGIAIAVIAVVLIASAVAGTYALGLWGGKVVPNVIGMTEPDAENALSAEGFTVRSTQVKSDDTEGLVLLMDPVADSRAPEGSEVVIHIAVARVVPELVGQKLDDAQLLLEEAGFDNVEVSTVKSDEEENIVVSATPEAGTRAKSNAVISVTVTEAYRVPDISDLDIGAAREEITDVGLTPVVEYVDTEKYVDGTILGTTPDAGSRVSGGETVVINVARARGAELEELTEGLLSPGGSVTIDGVDYDIESLDYVEYEGDDVVSFSLTGRPKITFFGETLYASSSQTVEGSVEWSENNKVLSIS